MQTVKVCHGSLISPLMANNQNSIQSAVADRFLSELRAGCISDECGDVHLISMTEKEVAF